MGNEEERSSGIKRVKTGISGLDKLLKGGFPENRICVVTGGCGTGKTILGLEFIYKGAVEFNEPGVYVNLEEEKGTMTENLKSLGWDFDKLEKENKVRIIPYLKSVIGDIQASLSKGITTTRTQKTIQYLSVSSLGDLIKEAVKEIGAKRLVIDPWTAITLMAESEAIARMETMSFFKMLRELGVTTMVTVEEETGYWKQIYFLAGGVIELEYVQSEGRAFRGLRIRKIRGSPFLEGFYNFDITNKGIEINTENIFDGSKI